RGLLTGAAFVAIGSGQAEVHLWTDKFEMGGRDISIVGSESDLTEIDSILVVSFDSHIAVESLAGSGSGHCAIDRQRHVSAGAASGETCPRSNAGDRPIAGPCCLSATTD